MSVSLSCKRDHHDDCTNSACACECGHDVTKEELASARLAVGLARGGGGLSKSDATEVLRVIDRLARVAKLL